MHLPGFLVLLAVLLHVPGAAAQALPGLHFLPPQGFAGATSGNPAVYTSLDGEMVVHIYPFKRFRGKAEAEFRQSLFREHIPREYREPRPSSPPPVQPLAIRGADAAYAGRFTEERAGGQRQRMRVLVVAGDAVAIVDADAAGPAAWERHGPALQALLQSMIVKL